MRSSLRRMPRAYGISLILRGSFFFWGEFIWVFSLVLLWAKLLSREEFCRDNRQPLISLFLRMLEMLVSSIPVILKVKFKLLVYVNSSSFV